ncbi:MAG: hypothetical protein NDI94_05210 [Candidatus Woesearchaeota archaeon]|nr:hypothetical protein [Candidatus Woesearchaeota archaeon]
MARKFKFAPLNGAFMASSMLGILISLMYVYPKSFDWGITFAFIFVMMFVAAVISMSVADPDDFVELETRHRKKQKR